MSDFPILQTERLLLREITQEDVEGVFAFRSDPEGQFYNGGPISTLQESADLIAELDAGFRAGTMVEWGLALRNEPTRVIGLFGYANWSKEHRRAEIGYGLAREHWRQGLSHEALTRIVAYGFEEMDLNRMHACPWVENVASTRILEKLGFRLEGILRDEFWRDEAFHDEAHYALLRREYESLRK